MPQIAPGSPAIRGSTVYRSGPRPLAYAFGEMRPAKATASPGGRQNATQMKRGPRCCSTAALDLLYRQIRQRATFDSYLRQLPTLLPPTIYAACAARRGARL